MRLPPSLAEPQFRRYVTGNFFAVQAMWIQRTVIGWLAWDTTNSASWVGVIAFLSFAPTFVSGPIFGVFADRADLKRASIMVQVALAAVAAALFAAIFADALTIHVLAVIALTQGVAVSANHPVRLALTPRLAARAKLANVVAISALNFNLARLTGPAIGGYAIAHLGAAWTVAGAIALSLPMIAILTTLRPRALEGAPGPRTGVAAALTEGARYAWASPPIRQALSLTVLFAIVVRGFLELLAVVADGQFARGAAGFGELMAAGGAGALTAAVLLASRDLVTGPRTPAVTRICVFAGFAFAAGAAVSPIWTLALILTAASGFCGTIVGVTMQSVVQIAVDDAHRGRVLSLWIMVGIGSAVVGALIMGALADLVGLGPVMAVGSAAGAAVCALLLSGGAAPAPAPRGSASGPPSKTAFHRRPD